MKEISSFPNFHYFCKDGIFQGFRWKKPSKPLKRKKIDGKTKKNLFIRYLDSISYLSISSLLLAKKTELVRDILVEVGAFALCVRFILAVAPKK